MQAPASGHLLANVLILAKTALTPATRTLSMLSRFLALGLAALFVLGLAIFHPLTAFAGPIADYEAMFRDAYADYRNALFATNTKSTEASNKSITAFGAKWAALVARLSRMPASAICRGQEVVRKSRCCHRHRDTRQRRSRKERLW